MAVAPSNWETKAINAVVRYIITGLLPAILTRPLTMGSNIPASLIIPK